MAYQSFEITEMNLRLDAARLPALLAAARDHGYLQNQEPDEMDETLTPELAALHALLYEFFPCNWELSEDLDVSDVDFEWWPGSHFPVDDVSEVFATAAVPGSSITFLDFTEGDRDIYDVVFDGAGGFTYRYLVRDGAPLRTGP